ncbi:hypothetical protein B0H94_111100 [Salsuginibacillus halophilus]|uniref:Uncharacterized protein n=1 Tax=Salsuginibacillus halophilus TaxID=517424 RepID=A0A2P8HAL8_9BACI|nr:hypothetical protein [Salsuginibacillus halophilus]PSL43275.1 hypothetical protein B0H94_111100 [Salsuginibacillus halophilus]
MAYVASILSFFTMLALLFIFGETFGIEAFQLHIFRDTAIDGFRFETSIPWLPVVIAGLISHGLWRWMRRLQT